MKIVCDSCGAKYSIADEKVRGKVFKIRCKKCSEVIVVRGDGTGETPMAQTGADAMGAAAAPAAADTIWHLVVGGEQQGPFNPDQISQMLSTGQIDWEAYGWRDGLENWMHLREIDELVTAITGQAPQAAEPAPAPAAAATDLFGGGGAAQSAGGDLFGGGAASGGGGMFASAAAEPAAAPTAARSPVASARGRAGGADLFGGGADDEDVVASKSEAPDASGGAMTGARNENSVLFSLSNLQALATKGQAAPGPTAGVSGGGAKSGFASGGGSGLIDIRALAEGTSGASSSSSGGSKGIDDLLSIGGPSAFAPALGAPVLMPSRSEGGKLLYVLLGVAALLVLGIIGLVIVIMTKDDTPPVAIVAPPPVVQPSLPGSVAGAGAAPGTAASPTPAPSEQPAPSGDEGGDDERGGDARRGGGGARTGGPSKATGTASSGGSSSAGSSRSSTPDPTPTKRPDSRTADLDSLIGSALGGSKAPAPGARAEAPAAPARSNLPAQPSRGDVSSAMGAVTPAVRACGGGQTGTASIRIVFAGSGRVTTASVTSPPFAGTPAGSCMARAVRGARVPPFSNPSLTVTFPFAVR